MVDDIMISKKTIIIGGAVLAIIIFGAFSAISVASHKSKVNENNAITGKINTNLNSGEYQEATLKFENYEYVVEPNTLKKGMPVRMTVDLNTVTGCMRDIVINSFNVRKYVKQGDNTIEFTPDKTGTFWIVCSMNMGRGQFSVVEEDGTTTGFVETPESWDESPRSCGFGGGCGCSGTRQA